MFTHLKEILMRRDSDKTLEDIKAKQKNIVNPPKVGDKRSGRGGEEAAKTVGMSLSTARRSEAAVVAADALAASGDEDGANEILDALNNGHATQAAKLGRQKVEELQEPADEQEAPAAPKQPTIAKHLEPYAASVKEFRSAIKLVGSLREKLMAICDAPGGGKLNRTLSGMVTALGQIQVNLKTHMYHGPCPECKITDKNRKAGETCKLCRGHGWIDNVSGLNDSHRTWLKQFGIEM